VPLAVLHPPAAHAYGPPPEEALPLDPELLADPELLDEEAASSLPPLLDADPPEEPDALPDEADVPLPDPELPPDPDAPLSTTVASSPASGILSVRLLPPTFSVHAASATGSAPKATSLRRIQP
jgi:hypothetical protein